MTKLVDKNNTDVLSIAVEMGLIVLKPRWSRAAPLLEVLGQTLFPCLFQLLMSASIPWPMAPFFHLQSQEHWMSLSHTAISGSNPSWDYTGSPSAIQDNLLVLKSAD